MGLTRWLGERPTPLLWVTGAVGCGKTIAVKDLLRDRAAAVLQLSAFAPDDALAEAGIGAGQLATTALLRFATDQRVLVIDGLDALQQHGGQHDGDVTECRIRQLLFAACEHALPDTSIIVTSRLRPPRALPEAAITVLSLPGASHARPPSLPPAGTGARHILELAALGRHAIDPAAIERMSGIEERAIRQALDDLTEAHLVSRVSPARYQVPGWIKSSLLGDPARTAAVRGAAIEALRRRGSDPARLLDLLVDDGEIAEAIMVYWHLLGNFARLHHEGRHHLGAALCRRLNDGLGPDDMSPRFRAADGAWAVMNDWSQFSFCCGDAATSALAAVAACQALPSDRPQWDQARLAAHAAKGHLLAGNLRTAMEWGERSWKHARLGMRSTEGVAVREIMDAYAWSANVIAGVYSRLENPREIRRLIDDLVALEKHGRQSIDEVNASAPLPLARPGAEATPEALCDGRLAAMLALADGRFADLGPLVAHSAQGESPAGRELRTLLLRAQLACGRDDEAAALLISLRAGAERRDDCAAECELSVLALHRLAGPEERLRLAAAWLPRAQACGLGAHWRDLQLARARALEQLGLTHEACSAAQAALFGTAGIAGAYASGDWAAAREAAGLLQAAGRTVPDHVMAALEQSAPPLRESPQKATPRRPAPSSERGDAARESMHAAAVEVLDRYEKEGMPFVLYFRKFDFDVLHGPFELGPKLTENALRDALPANIEVVTIQDQGSMTYDLGPSRLRREAPALMLADEHWAEVAGMLIARADLIVSEALMLSEGVRLELQMIVDAGRWDRTVLLLPPQGGALPPIDNDGLIQMFPRCVWADALHSESLANAKPVADLIERLVAIARLPCETRLVLSEPSARDEAFPIDLLAIARHLESEAGLGSVFSQGDEATRYYAFWQMFRASSIRGWEYAHGDRSLSNRCKWAHSYLNMSNIMLDYAQEGDRFIFKGDPEEAGMLVRSAHALLREAGDDIWADVLRGQAEDQWETVVKLEQAMEENPLRFELRPLYGPLQKKKVA